MNRKFKQWWPTISPNINKQNNHLLSSHSTQLNDHDLGRWKSMSCIGIMRSNLCWLSCVVFVISVLPLDLIFMIACFLFWVEVSLCRFSCVVFYISVLPLDLIFVIACYFLEWDRICVGFLCIFTDCYQTFHPIQIYNISE
jgi:hypothetical protein